MRREEERGEKERLICHWSLVLESVLSRFASPLSESDHWSSMALTHHGESQTGRTSLAGRVHMMVVVKMFKLVIIALLRDIFFLLWLQ